MGGDAPELRLAVAPAGDASHPTSFARVYQHLPRLAREGFALELVEPQADPWAWYEALLEAASRADVLWLQDLLLPPKLARVLGRLARGFVFDVSEPLLARCPDDEHAERIERIERLGATAAAAGMVLVDHPVLADRIAALATEAVRAVPTRLPLGAPRRARPGERLVVGWPGVLGLPLDSLGPLLDAVAKPPLDERVRLRLIVEESRFERAALAATHPNVSPERVQGEGFDPLVRSLEAVDLVCLPLPAEPWGPGLSAFAAELPLARGVPVAISAGAPCAATTASPDWLRVPRDELWPELLRAAWEDRDGLHESAGHARECLRRRNERDEAFRVLAASLAPDAARRARCRPRGGPRARPGRGPAGARP